MSNTALKSALGGISGVHVTPYDANGAIDVVLLARIVDRIAAAGIHAVVSAGNTGEYYTLSEDEVRTVHDAALNANAGRAIFIACVGRALVDAIPLARRAAAGGADAILVHQPLDPFAAPQAQAGYFKAIAEASPVPVLAYLRSDTLSLADIMDIANHPNVVAIKFATHNLMRLADCVRASGPATARWICGLAEGWAPAFYAVGARGFTSGLVNVAPERSLAIHAALEAGNWAAAAHQVDEISSFETMRTRYGNGANVTVVKAALRLLGDKVGDVRLPGLPRLDAADQQALVDILRRWGLGPLHE